MKITKQDIEETNLDDMWSLLPENEDMRDWWAPFYKTFGAISQKLGPCHVLELGTRWGQSALAWGLNPQVEVETFDIWNWGQEQHYSVPNIKFTVGDGLVLEPHDYLRSRIIYLDVDPHNGIMELGFYRALIDMGFGGTVICDDIFDPESMQAIFWDKVDLPKVEFPEEFGHSTGMGAIFFGEERIEFE